MGRSLSTEKAGSKKGESLLLAIACTIVILGVTMVIQSFLRDGFPVIESMISLITAEPADWEDKTVKVEGILEEIPIGIIQPFNYWLADKQNQTIRVGLRWHSDSNLSGKSLTVVGVVKKGYAWVNPNYPGWWTYYIEATYIY